MSDEMIPVGERVVIGGKALAYGDVVAKSEAPVTMVLDRGGGEIFVTRLSKDLCSGGHLLKSYFDSLVRWSDGTESWVSDCDIVIR